MMIICVMTDRSFYHKEWWFCRTLTVSFKSPQTKEAINHPFFADAPVYEKSEEPETF